MSDTETSNTLDSAIAERDLFRHELRLIGATLRDAADEWEASGDDEKLVNGTVDPLITRIAHVLGVLNV